MQKETKKQKAERELEERLKKMAAKHHVVQPISNPLLEQAREKLKPDFGLESARMMNVPSKLEREISGASAERSAIALVEKEVEPRSKESSSDKTEEKVEPIQAQISANEAPSVDHKVENRKKKLIRPSWEVDLEKDFQFVADFLCKHLGTRQGFAIRLFQSLYEVAKRNQNPTVHATREEIFKMVQTNASSTVTRAIEFCATHGLFERQVFPFSQGDAVAGTYFHLKTPWKYYNNNSRWLVSRRR